MKRILAAALLSLLVPGAAAAQQIEIDNTRYGGTAAQFLTLPGDARGAALGSSYAALVTDVSSMFWNPAGLAMIDGRQAMFSYTAYVADTHHLWGGVAVPLREGQWGLGVSVANFGFGDQPEYTEEFPDGTGATYDVSETAIGLTFAAQFSDRFSMGMTGRFVNQQLARTSASGFTIDFGTNFHTEFNGRPIRASFVVLNFGTSFQAEGSVLNANVSPIDESQNVEQQPARIRSSAFEPPTQFRVGLAYDLLATEASRLTALGEFSQPNDSDPGFGFAGEYQARVAERLSAGLRASYSFQADNLDTDVENFAFESDLNSDANLDGLAFGGGLTWEMNPYSLSIDYAFRHLGVLSAVNMFSLKLGW